MMEKQQKILDMAKDICRVKLNCNDVCNPISACDALRYAERAVEAGYVKQSEGEWIAVPKRGLNSARNRRVNYFTFTCPVCGKSNGKHKSNYCPNCGTKMVTKPKGADNE